MAAEQAPMAIELDLVRRQILLTARAPSPAAHNKIMGTLRCSCGCTAALCASSAGTVSACCSCSD